MNRKQRTEQKKQMTYDIKEKMENKQEVIMLAISGIVQAQSEIKAMLDKNYLYEAKVRSKLYLLSNKIKSLENDNIRLHILLVVFTLVSFMMVLCRLFI